MAPAPIEGICGGGRRVSPALPGISRVMPSRDVDQGAAAGATASRRAGACGPRALADRRPPTAMPSPDRTQRAAASDGAVRSARTICSCRTRWPVLRSPAAARVSACNGWHRPVRPVPGRRLHPPQCGARLYHRRARLWLAGRHHRSHRDHCRRRSPARAFQRQRVVRPRSKAVTAFVDAMARRRWLDALCRRRRSPRSTCPAYAEQASWPAPAPLRSAYARRERHRHPQRTRPAHRQVLRRQRRDPDAARPRGMGARLQSAIAAWPPRSSRCPAHRSRCVNGAAPARGRGADHGLGRDELPQRLLGRRDASRASSRCHAAAMPARAWCVISGDE